MTNKRLAPFAAALQEDEHHKDRVEAGKLMTVGDLQALRGDQRDWHRVCMLMLHRGLPPFDGRKPGPRSNALHRRTERLANDWKDHPERSVRDASRWMSSTLVEMRDSLHRAVYVFGSSKYPSLLKIGSASNGVVIRVRAQIEQGETLTLVRTYKSIGDVQVLEKTFHTHFDPLRQPLAGRTECFTVGVDDLDRYAEELGLYIYPHELRIRW